MKNICAVVILSLLLCGCSVEEDTPMDLLIMDNTDLYMKTLDEYGVVWYTFRYDDIPVIEIAAVDPSFDLWFDTAQFEQHSRALCYTSSGFKLCSVFISKLSDKELGKCTAIIDFSGMKVYYKDDDYSYVDVRNSESGEHYCVSIVGAGNPKHIKKVLSTLMFRYIDEENTR